MILTVSHATIYRYSVPMRSAVQSLRLRPSEFDGQSPGDWAISVTGGERGAVFRDGAGDLVESWSVRGPVEELEIRVEGEVETRDLSGVLAGHREVIRPEVYLRKTQSTRADLPMTEAARDAVAGLDAALDQAHALSAAVAGAITYRPGATETRTSAAEAFALGEGVCQDHAHVLIGMARAVGLPARYVSGYLFADAEGNTHEAAHAWAEIHVGTLGWVAFDAANHCCADERYIRLGSGLDARDAAPILGVASGAGEESLEVNVAVQQVQQ